ncbi:MAG: hypothetical protein QOD06_2060 [Candidatus Binatota bacterium]|nr:hypothetical protein [Candidatus Binatota bacterium]
MEILPHSPTVFAAGASGEHPGVLDRWGAERERRVWRDVGSDLEHDLIAAVHDECGRVPRPAAAGDVDADAAGEAQQPVSREWLTPDGEHIAEPQSGPRKVDHATGLQRPGGCMPERVGHEAIERRTAAGDADAARHDDHAAVREQLEVHARTGADVAAQTAERRRSGQRPARRRLVLRPGADRHRREAQARGRGEGGKHRFRRYLGVACLLGLLLVSAPAARADGDPPSDILPSEDVYYGYGIDLRTKAAAQLPALLAVARERGYELKVALISGYADLGVVGSLWLDPREYARYLGQELSLVYKGRLIVLMRNGYGIYYDGVVPGKERRVISRLGPPGPAARFLESAIAAVRALAASNGVKLAVPDVEPPPGGIKMGQMHATPAVTATASATAAASAAPVPSASHSSAAWLFLAPIGLFVFAALAAIALSRRRVG